MSIQNTPLDLKNALVVAIEHINSKGAEHDSEQLVSLLRRHLAALENKPDLLDTSFKNFHKMLCDRFGYVHDEKDWVRDTVSLEEHIAKLVSFANPVMGKVQPEVVGHYWTQNFPYSESTPKVVEVRMYRGRFSIDNSQIRPDALWFGPIPIPKS